MTEQKLARTAGWRDIDTIILDASGETRFVKTCIPNLVLDEARGRGRSAAVAAQHVFFASMPGDLDIPSVVPPERRLTLVLRGLFEITVSTGETRRWGPGEMLIAANVGGGTGHRTRSLSDDTLLLVVAIDDELDLTRWQTAR